MHKSITSKKTLFAINENMDIYKIQSNKHLYKQRGSGVTMIGNHTVKGVERPKSRFQSSKVPLTKS